MSELPVQRCGTLGSSTAWFKPVAAGSYWTGRHSHWTYMSNEVP